MDLKEKYGETALIAGASEGIGAAFAAILAAAGMNLVLVARRMQPLQILAGRLENEYKVHTSCISCDLGNPDAVQQLQGALNGREINLLVYNAALSYIGPFTGSSSENNGLMAQVNVLSPLNIVHVFADMMIKKGKGAIILMTSMAGLQGSGYLAVYAATKAFNRVLAESLWYEWKNSGVDIIACCAGATSTDNYLRTKPEKTGIFTPRVLAPEEVAAECLKKLGRQPSLITGRGNRIASFLMQRILPRRMAINIMGDTTRKMYRL